MLLRNLECFDWFEDEPNSRAMDIVPYCYGDNRGYFMEVVKDISHSINENEPVNEITSSTKWIKQINRSSSVNGVIRGCHSQRGAFCQGKLVEAVTGCVYDIITDARPNSSSFGVSTIVLLSSELHNKLWIPRGFLHSFVVPLNSVENTIFEYMCDNVYDKKSEVTINPKSVLPRIIESFKESMKDNEFDLTNYEPLYTLFENEEKCIYSEKDLNGLDYVEFMEENRKNFHSTREVWYK